MERPVKITLLEAIEKGASLEGLLPSIEICLLELEKGYYTDPDQKRTVPAEMLESYIQRVKRENPNHILKLTIVGNEEVEMINKRLE